MSLYDDVKAMVESQGIKLYDATITSRNGETIYEVLLSSNEGVSLDQCAEISHLLSPLLDVTPPVSGEYRLEVGTPGIERKLKTMEHFELSIGEKVKITLLDGTLFVGTLKACEGESITVETQNGDETLDFSEVLKARTYFEW